MDRLSELPDELLIRILSFMPTLDAVRTMLLRRFGELWTLVPNLKFETLHFSERQRFMIFVRNVLMLHQAPVIDTFSFKFGRSYHAHFCWEDDENMVKDMYMWIKCGLKKQPKTVYLHFPGEGYFPLPSFLLTNQSIVYLSLVSCELDPIKGVHMGSLRSLVLYDVFTNNESFNDMISGCPLLETLTITACDPSHMIFSHERMPKLVFLEGGNDDDYFRSLACPNAKILNLYCHLARWFIEVDFSSVFEANIQFNTSRYRQVDDKEADKTMEFLKNLENAEILTFKGLALEDQTFPKNRWKVVTLEKTYCSVPCVVWICDLLRSSPFIEKLTINAARGFKYFEWNGDHDFPELLSPCVASHLSEIYIYIRDERDHRVLLQMVELFLKSAVELVELVIYFKGAKKHMKKKIHDLFRTFSRFARASSNAVISIYWEEHISSSSEAVSSTGLSTFRLSLMEKNILC